MSVALCRLGTGFVAELLRHGLGDTLFHNGSLGLSATSMAGVGKGFNREPGTTSEQVTQPYRFAGGYQDPPRASTTSPPATTTPTSAASPAPTRPARRRTPTSTPKATPSSASTHSARSASAASGTRSASARSSRRLYRGAPGRPRQPQLP